MAISQHETPVRDGRATRTALLGFLAAGCGPAVFDDPADTAATAAAFTLMMLAAGALIIELTDQARRHHANRWTRTDTVIAAILVGYAVPLLGAASLHYLSPPKQTAAASFGALYLILGACFCVVRRRTVRH
ncbi:hypothetical protein [Paractinoplanes atraurantiacus]|uniref:Uncharacterized protein n=1 Tax=Paractinoplanes atraurantiacus TaxID=1036182 RepID=A0A285K7X4_9ACTN|nr:hypothetical protein [Actinoplanes atraurantiacus]SNY68675.1 hypothetical protein SAMN05421748_133109 [Actinoplanes atraurantiacus]